MFGVFAGLSEPGHARADAPPAVLSAAAHCRARSLLGRGPGANFQSPPPAHPVWLRLPARLPAPDGPPSASTAADTAMRVIEPVKDKPGPRLAPRRFASKTASVEVRLDRFIRRLVVGPQDQQVVGSPPHESHALALTSCACGC